MTQVNQNGYIFFEESVPKRELSNFYNNFIRKNFHFLY